MTRFFDLPNEIIEHIFSFNNLADLENISQVCHSFYIQAQKLLNHQRKIAAQTLFPYINQYGGNKTVAKLPGHLLAISGWNGVITLWDYWLGKSVQEWNSPYKFNDISGGTSIHSLIYLGDNQLFMIGTTKNAYLFNYQTTTCIKYELPFRPYSLLQLTASEIAIGAADTTIQILNLQTSQVRVAFVGHQCPPIALARWSDTSIISADSNGLIGIWQQQSTMSVKMLNPNSSDKPAANDCIKLSATEIAGAYDDGIRIWHYATGRCLSHLTLQFNRRIFKGQVNTETLFKPNPYLSCKKLLALPDNKLVAAYGDGTVRIWDYKGARCIQTITVDGYQKLIKFGMSSDESGLIEDEATIKV